MAEHSAMLGQIFSADHFGVPYLKRLAEINLVNGQNEAALKYLRLLSKESGYEKWISEYDQSPVLYVNINEVDLIKNPEHLDLLCDKIKEILGM